MEEGKIYDVVWDNGCFDCDDNCNNEIVSYSVFNSTINQNYENCYENITSCKASSDTNTCDPKFYVTWFGTDKNGNQLKSANLALSKFKHYSINSLYDSVKNIFS